MKARSERQERSPSYAIPPIRATRPQERKGKKTVLFPIRLDNTILKCETGWPADIQRTRHIGDFTRWKDYDAYQKALERVLRDLKMAQAEP
jgi:hypothetical protein